MGVMAFGGVLHSERYGSGNNYFESIAGSMVAMGIVYTNSNGVS